MGGEVAVTRSKVEEKKNKQKSFHTGRRNMIFSIVLRNSIRSKSTKCY